MLQHWWKSKQFIQVDEDYLEHCGTSLSYVQTPQKEIPQNFKTNDHDYVENLEQIDKPESVNEDFNQNK